MTDTDVMPRNDDELLSRRVQAGIESWCLDNTVVLAPDDTVLIALEGMGRAVVLTPAVALAGFLSAHPHRSPLKGTTGEREAEAAVAAVAAQLRERLDDEAEHMRTVESAKAAEMATRARLRADLAAAVEQARVIS